MVDKEKLITKEEIKKLASYGITYPWFPGEILATIRELQTTNDSIGASMCREIETLKEESQENPDTLKRTAAMYRGMTDEQLADAAEKLFSGMQGEIISYAAGLNKVAIPELIRRMRVKGKLTDEQIMEEFFRAAEKAFPKCDLPSRIAYFVSCFTVDISKAFNENDKRKFLQKLRLSMPTGK